MNRLLLAAVIALASISAAAGIPHRWQVPFVSPSSALLTEPAHQAVHNPFPGQPASDSTAPACCGDSTLPPPVLLGHALHAMVSQGDKRGLLFVADMSEPNTDPRLWVIDTSGQRLRVVMRTQVAHGIGSDPHRTGVATQFSNRPNSLMTSLGAYRIGEQYEGHSGLSYHLLGLSPSDSNAEARDIELHRADYVSPDHVGWSQGCLAVSPAAMTAMVKRFGDLRGALVYVGTGKLSERGWVASR